MPRCPRCGSDDVTAVVYTASRRSRRAGQACESPPTSVHATPVDRTSPNHRCESCGHAWPDQARLDAVEEIRSYFAALRAE